MRAGLPHRLTPIPLLVGAPVRAIAGALPPIQPLPCRDRVQVRLQGRFIDRSVLGAGFCDALEDRLLSKRIGRLVNSPVVCTSLVRLRTRGVRFLRVRGRSALRAALVRAAPATSRTTGRAALESEWIDVLERRPDDVRLQVEVGLSWEVHRRRIRTHPPVQERRVVPLPEVLEPDLDVLFLTCEARLRRERAARISGFPGAIRSLEIQRPDARSSCSDENP